MAKSVAALIVLLIASATSSIPFTHRHPSTLPIPETSVQHYIHV